MNAQSNYAANDRQPGFDPERKGRVNRAHAHRQFKRGSPEIARLVREAQEIDRLIEAARVKYGRGTPIYRQEVLSLYANGPTPAHYERLGVERGMGGTLASKIGGVI